MAKDKYSSGDGYMYVYLLSIVACIVVALVVALMVFGSGLFKNDDDPLPPIGGEMNSNTSQSGGVTSEEDDISSEPSRFTQGSIDNAEVNNGLLVLVNSDNRYVFPEENDRVNLYAALKGSNISFSGTGLYLNKTPANALKSMCQAFYNDTGLTTGVLVYSSYLSYEDASASDTPELAGASDYHTGNTVRLSVYPSHLGKMGQGQYEWFVDNCYSYGFIMRYPEGKEDITLNTGSRSVFRYVGVCHAYYMYKNNLCLEEYLDLLKDYTPEEPLIIDVQNKSYEVYYQPMEDGLTSTINVPIDSNYLISGNNYDGFIITITG